MRPIRTAMEADLGADRRRLGAMDADSGSDRQRFGTLGLTRMRGPTRRLNERWMRHGEHDLPSQSSAAPSNALPAPSSQTGSARPAPLWARPLRVPTSAGDVEGWPTFLRHDEVGSSRSMQASAADSSVEPPDFTESLGASRGARAGSLLPAFDGPYGVGLGPNAFGPRRSLDAQPLFPRTSIEALEFAAARSPFEVYRARRRPVGDYEFAAAPVFEHPDLHYDAFAAPFHFFARSSAFGQAQDALDGADYESLWALGSQLGDVVPRTTTAAAIEAHSASMPVVAVKEAGALATCTTGCLICLDDYEADDRVRVLSCRHGFHVGWFVTARAR